MQKQSECRAAALRFFRLAALLSAAILIFASCEETTLDPPWVKVRILAPADGSVIQDSVLLVRVELTKNCGCLAQCEFYVNGEHRFTDFVPGYEWDWDVRNVSGERTITVRGVVVGSAEARDSVRVTINP